MKVLACLAAVDFRAGLFRTRCRQSGAYFMRMNIYDARAKNGNDEIVKTLGVIEPKECAQGIG